jgi:hypothetical protein
MNIVAITGVGPRTGTSFVMQKAKEAGLPIYGHKFLDGITVPEYNPEGYWDIYPDEIVDCWYSGKLDNKIVKLWNPILKVVDQSRISHVLILERQDKLAQLSSLEKVFAAESQLDANKQFIDTLSPTSILTDHILTMNEWVKKRNKTTIKRVFTEDLNESIDEILVFLERGLQCQHL